MSKNNSTNSLFTFISYTVFIFIIAFLLFFIILIIAPGQYATILKRANEFAVNFLFGAFAGIIFIASFVMQLTNSLGITSFNVQNWRDLAVANANKIINYLRSIFPF